MYSFAFHTTITTEISGLALVEGILFTSIQNKTCPLTEHPTNNNRLTDQDSHSEIASKHSCARPTTWAGE